MSSDVVLVQEGRLNVEASCDGSDRQLKGTITSKRTRLLKPVSGQSPRLGQR